MADTTGIVSTQDGESSMNAESMSHLSRQEQGRTSYDHSIYLQQQLLPGDESAAWQQQQQPYVQHQTPEHPAMMSAKESAGAGSVASSIGPASVPGSEMSLQDHEAMLQQQQQQYMLFGNGTSSMPHHYAGTQQAFYGPSGMPARHAYPGGGGGHPQPQFVAPPSMMIPPGSPMQPGYHPQQQGLPPSMPTTPGVPAPGPGNAPRGGVAAPGMMQGPGPPPGSMNYQAMMPMHPHAAASIMMQHQQQEQQQQQYFLQQAGGGNGGNGGRTGQPHRSGQNAYGQFQYGFQQARRPSAGSSPNRRNGPYQQQGTQGGGASNNRGGNNYNNTNNNLSMANSQHMGAQFAPSPAPPRGGAGHQQASLAPASSAPVAALNNSDPANSVFTRLPPLPPLPPIPEEPKDLNLPQQPWGLEGVLSGSDPVGALVRYTQQLEGLVEAYKKREEARIMQIEALAFDPAVALRAIKAEGGEGPDGAARTPEDAQTGQLLAPVLGIRLLQRVQELTEENEEIGKMLASKMGLDGSGNKTKTDISSEQHNLAQELEDAHTLIKQMDHALTSAEQALSIAVANNSVGISEELAKADRNLAINPTTMTETGSSHPPASPIPNTGAPPHSSSQARPPQKERNANGGQGGSSKGGRGGARGSGADNRRPADRRKSSASTRPSA